MADKIDDIVVPILRAIQADVAVLKEHTGKIDLRLKSVEAHMTGFMSSARYLEHEMDQLRGRVEALEKSTGDKPQR